MTTTAVAGARWARRLNDDPLPWLIAQPSRWVTLRACRVLKMIDAARTVSTGTPRP